MKSLITSVQIEQRIYVIRGHKVMLDSDLAALYKVTNKRLVEQVRRNLNRFPDDFMVRLTLEESQDIMRSKPQFAALKRGHNVKYAHMAFTEAGIGMLSSVLRSERAAQVNIMIIRAFIHLRSVLLTHKDLAKKMEELEQKLSKQDRRFKNHGAQIKALFDAIWNVINSSKAPIGFTSKEPPQ